MPQRVSHYLYSYGHHLLRFKDSDFRCRLVLLASTSISITHDGWSVNWGGAKSSESRA